MGEDKEIILSKELQDSMSLGDIFVKSGMFPTIKTQAQAVVKILVGKELGMTPLESIANVYIVNGQVAMMAKGIAALIKRSKKYDYDITKLDDKECVLTFYQLNGERRKIGEHSFSWQDAVRAGLVNKQSWKDYPKPMLFNRCLSAGAKIYCPDVFSGYIPEELEDIKMIEPQKETIEITPTGEVKKDGS